MPGDGDDLAAIHACGFTATLAATLDRCAGALRQVWTVLAETEVDGPVLVRRIVTFREEADGRHRRGEETHRLLLRSPQEVLARAPSRRPRSAARSGRSGRR